MTTWGVTAGCLLLALGTTACSSDAATAPERTVTSSTTSTTEASRPTSTTTTTYAPDSIEGQVEAAYLRSWDVYADAVYHLKLDEQALAEVFAEEHLATKRQEIQRRIDEGRASWARIDHSYSIQLVDERTAIVIDRYRNHQRLIDPVTKEPVEPDPDEAVDDAITLRLVDGAWRVTRIEELR